MSFIPQEQIEPNLQGNELSNMQLPAQSGYAGRPMVRYMPYPSSRSMREGSFFYCVAVGFGIALALSFGFSPGKAALGGLAPLAVWLVGVTFLSARSRFQDWGTNRSLRREAKRQQAAAAAQAHVSTENVTAEKLKREHLKETLEWGERISLRRNEAIAKHLTRPAPNADPLRQAMTQRVLERAVQELGLPYASREERARGVAVGEGIRWDCSSFVQWAWGPEGVHLPDGADNQFHSLSQLPESTPLQPGDLVFFGTKNADGTVTANHVGLYVNGDDGPGMIEASHKDTPLHPDGGVKVPRRAPTFQVGHPWGKDDVYLGASRPSP